MPGEKACKDRNSELQSNSLQNIEDRDKGIAKKKQFILQKNETLTNVTHFILPWIHGLNLLLLPTLCYGKAIFLC